jgi:ectoine hydroxylase-related dioxygenase (phytanoyl-CoA dioxygenase family)
MLTEAQMDAFRRDGFLAIAEFWTPEEVAAMQTELDRLKTEGLLRNVATGSAKANLQITETWKVSPVFRAAALQPKIASLLAALLEGGPVFQYFDQIFLKPGRSGAPTNWHQDNHYFKLPDPAMAVGVWTAVHPATVANGTMRFVPGAHRATMPHRRDPESDHHWRCDPDEAKAVPVELPAGGVVVFTYGAPHATGRNDTDAERAGFAMHFAHAEHGRTQEVHLNRHGQPMDYTPGRPGRPFILGPQATHGQREYGEDARETWSRLIGARAIA